MKPVAPTTPKPIQGGACATCHKSPKKRAKSVAPDNCAYSDKAQLGAAATTIQQGLTGATNGEKRSLGSGIDHSGECEQVSITGGGGSARPPRRLAAGGGYLDICNGASTPLGAPLAPAPDPRLAELRRAGLPQPWPRVAASLGYDTFMEVWQALATVDGADSRRRVVLPKIQPYLRHQRNLLIRSMGSQGLSAEEIRRQLLERGCEAPTVSHINKLLAEA